VEECTRAEIGVGAAIAIGSQGEKGKIALLVISVTINSEAMRILDSLATNQEPCAGEERKNKEIVTKKKQSPIRFMRSVNRPEVKED
jgi:hypothetical protein